MRCELRDLLDPDDVFLGRRAEASQHLEPGDRELRRALAVRRCRAVRAWRSRRSSRSAAECSAELSCSSFGTSTRPSRFSTTLARCLAAFASASTSLRFDTGASEHPRQANEDLGREVGAERVGGVVGEGVRLVEDHEVVLGKHVAVRREVRAVEGVVDDEDVDALRPFSCELGEAVVAVAAVAPARALHRRAAHGRPRRVGDRVVDLGAVAGLGAPWRTPRVARAASEKAATTGWSKSASGFAAARSFARQT